MLAVSVTESLSTTYRLPLESLSVTEQMYSPLSAVSTLDVTNEVLSVSCLPPGVVQWEEMLMEVSTEGGRTEQERERGEPDTNSLSEAVTITTGLGTEGDRHTSTSTRGRERTHFEP